MSNLSSTLCAIAAGFLVCVSSFGGTIYWSDAPGHSNAGSNYDISAIYEGDDPHYGTYDSSTTGYNYIDLYRNGVYQSGGGGDSYYYYGYYYFYYYYYLADVYQTYNDGHGSVITYKAEGYDDYDTEIIEDKHLVSSKPFSAFDSVTPSVVSGGIIVAMGWSADPRTGGLPQTVQALIDGSVVSSSFTTMTRTDVALVYDRAGFTNSGWKFTISSSGLSVGSHTFTVRTTDSIGRVENKSKTFTVTAATPAAPGSPNPGSGSGNRSLSQNISWGAATGATSYDVYFGTDSSPDSSEFKGNQSGTSYNPGTLAAGTTYYWKVVAKNSAGSASSSVWSFTTGSVPSTPSSPTPGSGSTNRSLGQDIYWGVASGATSYDVYFGTDSTPDSGEFKVNQTGTSYNPGSLSPGTTYYWKIVAKNSFGSSTSSTWNFTTGSVPGSVGSPSPGNGASNQNPSQNLTWSSASGATSYDVYFGTDSSPDSGEFKGNQSGTSYSTGTLAFGTTYYWKIVAKNSFGSTSSSVWSFTTGAATSAPSGPTPIHGAVNQSLTQEVSWAAASGATSYDVYFGTDSTPDSGEFKGNQTGLNYDPGLLTIGTTYYWKIVAKNSVSSVSGPVWSFTAGSSLLVPTSSVPNGTYGGSSVLIIDRAGGHHDVDTSDLTVD